MVLGFNFIVKWINVELNMFKIVSDMSDFITILSYLVIIWIPLEIWKTSTMNTMQFLPLNHYFSTNVLQFLICKSLLMTKFSLYKVTKDIFIVQLHF